VLLEIYTLYIYRDLLELPPN